MSASWVFRDEIDRMCSIFHELTYVGYGTERVKMIFEEKFRELGVDFDTEYERWGNEDTDTSREGGR